MKGYNVNFYIYKIYNYHYNYCARNNYKYVKVNYYM